MTSDRLQQGGPFHFPELHVVEASAGSGKTFALAKRYVQLLLSGSGSLRETLAITFTNKAAVEMKVRILDFLKKIALGTMPPAEVESVLAPIGLTIEAAAPEACVLLDGLLRNYNFFQVQTIDSFINTLLSGCAFKMGLSAHFRIRHNAFDYLQYGLDRLIERAAHDAAAQVMFEQFLHQYLFLENKASWFPKRDMLRLMMALYQQTNTYALTLAPYPIDEELVAQKAKIMTAMRRLREVCPDEADGRFVNSLDRFLALYDKAFDFDRVPDFFARDRFPMRAGAATSAEAEDLWEEIRHRLKRLSEAEALSLFNPYIEVFSSVLHEAEAKARQDDVVFLEELNRKARLLFDHEGITVAELYYRLAMRFRHYLIDEFQDTSVLQWKNLRVMAEEALSTGGSVFYVGDKKQAIYGFRGGEVRLFDHVQEEFRHFHVTKEQLEWNYRSTQAIVDFNNEIFSIENLRRFVTAKEDLERERNKKDPVVLNARDRGRLEGIFAHGRQRALPSKTGGHVALSVIPGDTVQEQRAETRVRLLALIAELRTRHDSRDIVVLTRENSDVELVTGWLSAEGISVESERTLSIKSNPLVLELVALLRFLDSPIDNPSFVSFIVGEAFCRAAGVTTDAMHAFVFSLRQRLRGKESFYVYRAFRDAFPQSWQRIIEPLFRSVGLYPLYELVVSAVHRLGIFDHFPDQQGFIMKFLELIKRREEEGSDIDSFLTYFEANEHEHVFVHVARSDSIRVMTTHKAKGLEFPVVILPFLEMRVRVGQTSGGSMGQQSFVVNMDAEHMELLRIKNKYLKYSERLSAIYQKAYAESLISELNNLYVALTRAAEEMYVLIPQKAGNSVNLVTCLVPEGRASWGAPMASAERAAEPGVVSSPLPCAGTHDWIEFLNQEFGSDEGVARYRDRIRQGKVLHAMLQQIVCVRAGEEARPAAEAARRVRQMFPEETHFDEYEERLIALLRRDEVRAFFDVAEDEVFCEQDIVGVRGETLRVDRCVVRPNEVWVIEYKIRRLQGDVYAQQVRRYMEILAGIYPDKRIKGFLLYLEEAALESVEGGGR